MNQSEQRINRIEGFRTIGEIEKILNVKRSTAIKYVHLLRKQGLVRTLYKKDKTRIYRISRLPEIKIGNESFYDIINKYSPIKITNRYEYRIIGRKLSVEEAVIKAIETKNIKVILAALALFNKVNDWRLLHKSAKQHKIKRKVGALYELAKRYMRVRKIDDRILKALLKKDEKEDKYIVDNFKSKDFNDIEKKWNVFIPFNKIDMEEYKEWR